MIPRSTIIIPHPIHISSHGHSHRSVPLTESFWFTLGFMVLAAVCFVAPFIGDVLFKWNFKKFDRAFRMGVICALICAIGCLISIITFLAENN